LVAAAVHELGVSIGLRWPATSLDLNPVYHLLQAI